MAADKCVVVVVVVAIMMLLLLLILIIFTFTLTIMSMIIMIMMIISEKHETDNTSMHSIHNSNADSCIRFYNHHTDTSNKLFSRPRSINLIPLPSQPK